MDDLRMLGTLLAEPGPTPEMLERSRQRLRDTMRGPIRRRRARWPAAMLGLTAVATAVAVAVAIGSRPAPAPGRSSSMSGRQVLLAAAVKAEAKPASSGIYWHVKRVDAEPDEHHKIVVSTYETWTRRDGKMWSREGSDRVQAARKRTHFELGGKRYTFAQLQRLPTDPEKLKAKAKEARNTFPGILISNLEDLLTELPVPPKVRATAFRALATLPAIQNLGKVKGGQHLRFSIDGAGTDIIIDPKTTNLSNEAFTDFGGEWDSMGTFTWTSEWTDELPR
ncbi:CU044_5270 family protein [Actinoallomurus bryophytorum]|uniref:CU044_5270 family protein n=1 Tax=Actinoallomurus bryophytorum TaxID=1490222 RepID=A0A543CQN7_9ACTN|nr:CU044_5270 family protein [Actinoallomurus bryophytorum]TQL99399.1 hypothetical protein FB559_5080 [Actinoallomurus bryophytorum]